MSIEAVKQEPVAEVYRAHYGGKRRNIGVDSVRQLPGVPLPPPGTKLYTAPPLRQPLTDEWVLVTPDLLYAQHPWLYQPMWIAMKGGVVVQGRYEWRQGRNPDRFITDLGDEWALNADFVMPITKPKHPAIEAKLKEKNT